MNITRSKRPDPRAIISLIAGILILIIAMCSCRTKYVPVELKTTETVTLRDTTVCIQLVPYKDSVSVKADSSYLSNPYAYSWARVGEDGMLYHSLGIIPQAAAEGKIMFIDKVITKEIGVPVEVIKEVPKKLNSWERFVMGCGYGLIILLLVFVFIWFRRFTSLKIRD